MAGSEEVGGAATPEFQAIKTVMVVIGMYVMRTNLLTIPQLGACIFEGALLFFVLCFLSPHCFWSAGFFLDVARMSPQNHRVWTWNLLFEKRVSVRFGIFREGYGFKEVFFFWVVHVVPYY